MWYTDRVALTCSRFGRSRGGSGSHQLKRRPRAAFPALVPRHFAISLICESTVALASRNPLNLPDIICIDRQHGHVRTYESTLTLIRPPVPTRDLIREMPIHRPPPSSKELKEQSPTLARLLKTRLAPIREEALLNAARSSDKPSKPPAGDCCGSSCKPCVMDLYREELKVWKECESLRGDSMSSEAEKNASAAVVDGIKSAEGGREMKVPGAFEW